MRAKFPQGEGWNIITIDCREMIPPEPLVRVMEAALKLDEKDALLMLHRKRPVLLFPKLDEQGLLYELKEFEDGSIELFIWREPVNIS